MTAQDDGPARVKATFYFDPDNLAALEAERLRRIAAGVRRSETGLSDLVNEAVRKTFNPTPQAAAIRGMFNERNRTKKGGTR
jgi:hypothetical protein